jgi:hypothetical protein
MVVLGQPRVGALYTISFSYTSLPYLSIPYDHAQVSCRSFCSRSRRACALRTILQHELAPSGQGV